MPTEDIAEVVSTRQILFGRKNGSFFKRIILLLLIECAMRIAEWYQSFLHGLGKDRGLICVIG